MQRGHSCSTARTDTTTPPSSPSLDTGNGTITTTPLAADPNAAARSPPRHRTRAGAEPRPSPHRTGTAGRSPTAGRTRPRRSTERSTDGTRPAAVQAAAGSPSATEGTRPNTLRIRPGPLAASGQGSPSALRRNGLTAWLSSSPSKGDDVSRSVWHPDAGPQMAAMTSSFRTRMGAPRNQTSGCSNSAGRSAFTGVRFVLPGAGL